MLKSVKETRKLFHIEGLHDGQVNIKTSRDLLSLPENKQVEVLNAHLENLRKDLARYQNLKKAGPYFRDNDIDRVQIQLLIEVIEGLLAQV
jgi:hypothetical protein